MKGKQLRHSVFLYFLLIYSPERNELKAVLIKSSLIEENHYIKCRRICQGAMYVIQDLAPQQLPKISPPIHAHFLLMILHFVNAGESCIASFVAASDNLHCRRL